MKANCANPFSGKPKSKPVVDHIRVHRTMEGGHRIEQHHTGYEHEPAVKDFTARDKAKAAAHLLKVTGLHDAGEEQAEGEE